MLANSIGIKGQMQPPGALGIAGHNLTNIAVSEVIA